MCGSSVAAVLASGHDSEDRPAGELLVAPVGAFYMRCCSAWEEDENTVDFKTNDEVGYLHWSRAECRL